MLSAMMVGNAPELGAAPEGSPSTTPLAD
jgi:hypothetical protein